MRRHPPGWLAWPLAAVPLAVAAADIAAVWLVPGLASATWAESAAHYTVDALGWLGAPVVGAVVASRRPDLLYGWLLVSLGLVSAAFAVTSVYGSFALLVHPGGLPFGLLAASLAPLLWVVAILHLPFLLLLFPDGRLPSPRWRWLVRLVFGLGALILAVGLFVPGQMGVVPVDNPLGAGGTAGRVIEIILHATVAALFLCIIAAGISVFIRRKGAGPQERLQLKWFAYAAVVFALLLAVNGPVANIAGPLVNAVLGALMLNALFAAIGVAVLRYRLYEIDRIVSRTVSYALLSALLVVVYVVSVLLLSRLLAPVGAGSELAVAVATLAAAALFAPARRRIQHAVDRRFNRARYDAELVVTRLRDRLRDDVELEDVLAATRSAAVETVQPARAWLWLRSSEVGS
jgi:hypothetical protein